MLNSIVDECSRSPLLGSPPRSSSAASALSASFGAGILESTSLDEVLQSGMYANINHIQRNPRNISLSNSNHSNTSNHSNNSTHSNNSNHVDGGRGIQLPSNVGGNVLMSGQACNLQTADRSEDDEDDFDWSSIL